MRQAKWNVCGWNRGKCYQNNVLISGICMHVIKYLTMKENDTLSSLLLLWFGYLAPELEHQICFLKVTKNVGDPEI